MPWPWKLVSVWSRLLFYFIVLLSFFCYWSLPLLMFWAVKGGKLMKRHLLKLTGYSFPFLCILSPVNNANAMNSFESQTYWTAVLTIEKGHQNRFEKTSSVIHNYPWEDRLHLGFSYSPLQQMLEVSLVFVLFSASSETYGNLGKH